LNNKIRSSMYCFDGRLFEVCYVSSDGPNVTDIVISNTMRDAISEVELVIGGGSKIFSCKEISSGKTIRFTTEKAKEFLE